MPEDTSRPAYAAIRTDLGAIFVSLELSRRVWLITSLSPGAGEKMSKHSVAASDVSGLLRRFAELNGSSTSASVACIGPTTAAAAHQVGFTVDIEAQCHSTAGLLHALVDHFLQAGVHS